MSTITIEQQQCTCHSYNQQKGETPNVTLDVPESIRVHTDGRETVCIDACIADAIKTLWSNGLPTLNSCCGHNKDYPEVVIPEGSSPVDYLNVLADFDGRTWAVSRWERVKYISGHSKKKQAASLEAEPIYQLVNDDWYDTDKDTYDAVVSSGARGRIVYTAPPAPVSVPDERAELQGADGTLISEDTKRVGELVMWVKRLAHSLRKTNPDSKLQSDAMEYLSRKGLIGVEDILR